MNAGGCPTPLKIQQWWRPQPLGNSEVCQNLRLTVHVQLGTLTDLAAAARSCQARVCAFVGSLPVVWPVNGSTLACTDMFL